MTQKMTDAIALICQIYAKIPENFQFSRGDLAAFISCIVLTCYLIGYQITKKTKTSSVSMQEQEIEDIKELRQSLECYKELRKMDINKIARIEKEKQELAKNFFALRNQTSDLYFQNQQLVLINYDMKLKCTCSNYPILSSQQKDKEAMEELDKIGNDYLYCNFNRTEFFC